MSAVIDNLATTCHSTVLTATALINGEGDKSNPTLQNRNPLTD